MGGFAFVKWHSKMKIKQNNMNATQKKPDGKQNSMIVVYNSSNNTEKKKIKIK